MNKSNTKWIASISFFIVAVGLTAGLFLTDGDQRAKQFTCEQVTTESGITKTVCEKPEKSSN